MFSNESWESGEEMTTAKIRKMKSNPEEEVINDDLYHATRMEDTTTPVSLSSIVL